MTLLSVLRSMLRNSASRVVYECRICGVMMGDRRDRCRACGSPEIARYDLG